MADKKLPSRLVGIDDHANEEDDACKDHGIKNGTPFNSDMDDMHEKAGSGSKANNKDHGNEEDDAYKAINKDHSIKNDTTFNSDMNNMNEKVGSGLKANNKDHGTSPVHSPVNANDDDNDSPVSVPVNANDDDNDSPVSVPDDAKYFHFSTYDGYLTNLQEIVRKRPSESSAFQEMFDIPDELWVLLLDEKPVSFKLPLDPASIKLVERIAELVDFDCGSSRKWSHSGSAFTTSAGESRSTKKSSEMEPSVSRASQPYPLDDVTNSIIFDADDEEGKTNQPSDEDEQTKKKRKKIQPFDTAIQGSFETNRTMAKGPAPQEGTRKSSRRVQLKAGVVKPTRPAPPDGASEENNPHSLQIVPKSRKRKKASARHIDIPTPSDRAVEENNPHSSQIVPKRRKRKKPSARHGNTPVINASQIKWGNRYYTAEEPRIVSLEEAQFNFTTKTHIDDAIAQLAASADFPQQQKAHKQKLHSLKKILFHFLLQEHARMGRGHWKWQPQVLSARCPGIYLIVYPDGTLKFGMSFRCEERVMIQIGSSKQDKKDLEQSGAFAFLHMHLDLVRQIVPQSLVSQIKELELPQLMWNEDHETKLDDKISMQVVEMCLACSYECVTQTVAEQLVMLCSPRVQELVAPFSYNYMIASWLGGIPDGGMHCLATWPHLRARNHEIAELFESSFLRQRLRPKPEGGCVTFYLWMQLFGQKLGSIKDAVPYCPREKDLHKVLELLELPLQGDLTEEKMKAIRNALACIQGEHFEHYVRPTDKELADGAAKLLEQYIRNLPSNHVIGMERCSLLALEKVYPQWLYSVLDNTTYVDLVPEHPQSLCLRKTKTGHRVLIMSSFFQAFAEKVTKEVRLGAVYAYLALMDLLVQSNNKPKEDADRERAIMKSFAMALEFGDNQEDKPGSARAARQIAMPKDYFLSSPKNVTIVSDYLGIGSNEVLYLHEFLGAEDFGKVQVAHGLPALTPLQIGYSCTGVRGIEGIIDPQPCTNEDPNPQHTMIGSGRHGPKKKNSDYCHPLKGDYCCQQCHRNVERVELVVLQEKSADSGLTPSEAERLVQLEFSVQNKRALTKQRRKGLKSTKEGEAALLKEERAKERGQQSRRSQEAVEDPDSYKEKKADRRSYDEEQRKNGVTKAKGVNRILNAKYHLYPPYFQKMLGKAALLYAREYGEEYLYRNHVIDLFRVLLEKEKDTIYNLGIVHKGTVNKSIKCSKAPDGSTKYYRFAFDAAIAKAGIVPCKVQTKKWKWTGFTEADRSHEKREQTGSDIIAHVVKLVLGSASEGKVVEK